MVKEYVGEGKYMFFLLDSAQDFRYVESIATYGVDRYPRTEPLTRRTVPDVTLPEGV